MSYHVEIERGKELLELYRALQSEKDGIERPSSNSINRIEIDICKTTNLLDNLYELMPIKDKLITLGHKLEQEGKIQGEVGDSYVRLAFDYLLGLYESK